MGGMGQSGHSGTMLLSQPGCWCWDLGSVLESRVPSPGWTFWGC